MQDDVRWEVETDHDGDDRHSLHVRIHGCLTEVGSVTRMMGGDYTWALRIGDDTQQCEDAATLDRAKAALVEATWRALSEASVALLRESHRHA